LVPFGLHVQGNCFSFGYPSLQLATTLHVDSTFSVAKVGFSWIKGNSFLVWCIPLATTFFLSGFFSHQVIDKKKACSKKVDIYFL